jgi:hypothetical protein
MDWPFGDILGYFLSSSQQGVSANIIQISAVGNFSQKHKEQRQKLLGADKLVTTQICKLKNLMSLFSDVFSIFVHFEYYAIYESWILK